MKRSIEIVTVYREDDPDFLEDYTEVRVKLDGNVVVTYGDAHHEKGSEKANGFLDAVVCIGGAEGLDIKRTKVAEHN